MQTERQSQKGGKDSCVPPYFASGQFPPMNDFLKFISSISSTTKIVSNSDLLPSTVVSFSTCGRRKRTWYTKDETERREGEREKAGEKERREEKRAAPPPPPPFLSSVSWSEPLFLFGGSTRGTPGRQVPCFSGGISQTFRMCRRPCESDG